jgi:hypothetical protein
MSWQRVDLDSAEYDQPTEPPAVCGLIYQGARHLFSGPPKAAKTPAAFISGLEWMRADLGGLALDELAERGA